MEGFHTFGYTASANPSSLTAIAALADPVTPVNGNDVTIPNDFHFLWGAYGVATTLTRLQLSSPSLRRIFLHEIAPLDVGAAIPASPRKIFLNDESPIALDPGERLNANVTDGAGAAERITALVWIGPGPSKVDTRPPFTIRATSATTCVANTWTNGALTFDQTLPAGRYDVVGMRARSTNLIAARLVFVGGTYRPGCVGYAATTSLDYDKFRSGNLGVWGTFAHNAPPTVDFLANAADSSETVELDLVYLGPGGATT